MSNKSEGAENKENLMELKHKSYMKPYETHKNHWATRK
jgi:hypothetical protein